MAKLTGPRELHVKIVQAFQPQFLIDNIKNKNHPNQCVLQLPTDQFNYIKEFVADPKLFKKAENSIIVDYKSLGPLPNPGDTGLLRIVDRVSGGNTYRNISFLPDKEKLDVRAGGNLLSSSDPITEKSDSSTDSVPSSPSNELKKLLGSGTIEKHDSTDQIQPISEATAQNLVSELREMRGEMRELKIALMELTVTLKALRK
eukprot:TRINITY_DN10063_c0_g1_i1.p1 TRINITY_DN10063_c0_g1~~TRINITY_DN10063_c0_g1_i1.p1  ORF type:complete len:202 (+),score=34.73 TRINITY_DN10063_c0_g1_i1:58-663(+)